MALVPFRDNRAKSPRTSQGDESSPREGISGLLGDVSLLERLDDFRKRIVRSLLAVCLGMLVAFAYINPIVSMLLAPTRRALPAGARLIYTEPGEAFSLYIW